MTQPDYSRLDRIAKTYAPYHTLPAFWQGVDDYENHTMRHRDEYQGVDGQAYDRGLNAAMRWLRGDDAVGV